MSILTQILIVIAALSLLPKIMRLLWDIYLVPVAAYFTCTRLIWPNWAAANHPLCVGLFVASVLFFIGAWVLKIIQRRRENDEAVGRLVASAVNLYYYLDYENEAG